MVLLTATHKLRKSEDEINSYHEYRKETRKYYMSIGMDFQKHNETIEIDEQSLTTPQKYTGYYGDLILDNVSKPMKIIYKVKKDELNGSLIVFIDDTFQYTVYDSNFRCVEAYIGRI